MTVTRYNNVMLAYETCLSISVVDNCFKALILPLVTHTPYRPGAMRCISPTRFIPRQTSPPAMA
jgi:hypothetical protein